jgi:hypothetical protein
MVAASGVPMHETVVAFDCDLTLKAPGGVLRGGGDTMALLDTLRDAGATIVVVTATRPSRENWETIVRDLEKLGVLSYLGQGHGQQQPPTGLSTWGSESGKYTSRCWTSHGTSGTPFVAGLGVICSHYNKAACIHRYLLLYELQDTVRHLIFVDDFVANVVDVALHFSIEHAVELEPAPEPQLEPQPQPQPEPDQPAGSAKPVGVRLEAHQVLQLDQVSTFWWDPSGLVGITVGGYEDSGTAQWGEYRGWVSDGMLPDRLFEPPQSSEGVRSHTPVRP